MSIDDSVQEIELLECLRKIGKGLIAAGSSVGTVENRGQLMQAWGTKEMVG